MCIICEKIEKIEILCTTLENVPKQTKRLKQNQTKIKQKSNKNQTKIKQKSL